MNTAEMDVLRVPLPQLRDEIHAALRSLGLAEAHARAMTEVIAAGQRDACPLQGGRDQPGEIIAGPHGGQARQGGEREGGGNHGRGVGGAPSGHRRAQAPGGSTPVRRMPAWPDL